MTATPEVAASDTASNKSATITNPATGAVAGTVRWTDPADVPRIAAGLRQAQREWEARGAEGPRQGAGSLRRLDGRAPRRDRVAADQGDRQVGHGCRPRGAAADHDRVVLHQDDGEGAGAGVPACVAAVPVHQENHRALPAAPGRRHRRAVELPRGQPPDGWHRRPGGGLRGAAQTVRAHPADRRTVAARLDRLGRPEVMAIVQGAREAVEAVVDNADYVQFTGSQRDRREGESAPRAG